MKSAAPWVLLVCVAVGWWLTQGDAGESARIAKAAEARADSLGVVSDSLKALAVRQDTVIVTVLDSVRVVVTRERVVQVASVDTIRAHVDSVGAVALDSLLASEAREDVAQDRLQAETLAWGTSWQTAYTALEARYDATEAARAAWEGIAQSQRTRSWVERAGFVVAVVCVLKC